MATKTTTKTKEAKAPKVKKVKAPMSLEQTIYSVDGKKSGTIALPENVFGEGWNADLVHQVVTAMQANARTPVAHSKFRGEVSGTGKKPWAQKGTGRARHGSMRSPIWRKGGKAHGPRNEKDYSQKINKKVRMKALAVVLSKKLRDGEVLFVDTLSFKEPKTKDARTALSSLGKISGYEMLALRRKNAAYLMLGTDNKNAVKSFQNFGNMLVRGAKDANPVELLGYKYVVIVNPEEAVKTIASKWN
jgi:large subunit ribosomal protein L4